MAQAKYRKLLLTRITKYFVFLFTLLSLIFLVSCRSTKIPRPSNEFYVNDYANALSQATKENIVFYGEELYKGTKKIDKIGGLQIVFATFLLEEGQSPDEYNLTDIYRKWKIGKNDMGILTVLFFEMGDDMLYELIESEIVVGYRMEEYLPSGEMGRLLDLTLHNKEYLYDYDLATAHLLFEYLVLATTKVYPEQYVPFTYDLEEFIVERENLIGRSNYGTGSMQLFYYLFSPYSSIFEKIILGIVLILFLLFGFNGVFLLRNKGGGGSSGGMGISRRRK